MKLTQSHREIKIEFEESDSFEEKKMMQSHIQSIWSLLNLIKPSSLTGVER